MLACRCLARRVETPEPGFVVEAEAFLCGQAHKQGDFVSAREESFARMVESDWDRAEADYLEQR